MTDRSLIGTALADLVAEVVREEVRAAVREAIPPPAPPAPPSRELLKVDQVADLLQVKPATVREWIRGGHLRAVPLGPAGTRREYRIRREALDDFIAGQAAEPDDVGTKAAKIVRLARKR